MHSIVGEEKDQMAVQLLEVRPVLQTKESTIHFAGRLTTDKGTGTFKDPISFATATDNNNLPQCGIIYVPSLRKYFRNEDDCAQCCK